MEDFLKSILMGVLEILALGSGIAIIIHEINGKFDPFPCLYAATLITIFLSILMIEYRK